MSKAWTYIKWAAWGVLFIFASIVAVVLWRSKGTSLWKDDVYLQLQKVSQDAREKENEIRLGADSEIAKVKAEIEARGRQSDIDAARAIEKKYRDRQELLRKLQELVRRGQQE